MKIKIDIAFDAGKKLNLTDLKFNRGIGGTEYAVLYLAFQLSKYRNFKLSIITKYQLNIEENYNFKIKHCEKLDNANLTIVPEAYLKNFIINKSNSSNKLIIWLHHPSLNIDNLKLSYPNSILVALNNSQTSTFINKYENSIYVIKSFYQFIRRNNLQNIRLHEQSINFGFLGVLRPEKGLHHVASYWRYILKLYPNSTLHIIGSPASSNFNSDDSFFDNPYIAKIQKIIGKENLNSVKFYGRIDDLNEVLPNIDIALLNPFSSTEAYPDSILKFYEFGIPVLSGMFNGSSDLLNINSELQFPNMDPVKAIDKLIKDREMYVDSRNKVLEFIGSHNDLKTRELWKKLLLSIKLNDSSMSNSMLYNKQKKKFSIKSILKIYIFRIRYTCNYKMRLLNNELFQK